MSLFRLRLADGKPLMITPADRWTKTARLAVPIAALVFMVVWRLLRSSTNAIRKEIAQELVDVQQGKSVEPATVRLKKAR
jgi:hypothetical protein